MSAEERDQRFLEALEASSRATAALMTRVESLLAALRTPDVLFSGTVKLDANGGWSSGSDFPRPFEAVAIGAAANPVTVAFGSPQSSAPGFGSGVRTVGAGRGRVIAAKGNVLTLYGTAGDVIDVQIFGRLQPPAFGQT